MISIVLGTYNRLKFLKLTIENIRKEQKFLSCPSEIIVIDGGSTDGTIKWLTKQKDIISIIQHNRGYWQGKKIRRRSWGYFMNLGFKCAQGKYICMVSDDCLLTPQSLKNGYDLFETQTKPVGAIAFYHRNIPFHQNEWKKPGTYFVNKVFGKIYLNHGLYLKKALEKVNYIDEENYDFYCADVDLSFRLEAAGYQCIPAEKSYVEHYPHANIEIRNDNSITGNKDFLVLQKRWPGNAPIKNSFSSIPKMFFDKSQTVQKFKFFHITNTKLWYPIIKHALLKRFTTHGQKNV